MSINYDELFKKMIVQNIILDSFYMLLEGGIRKVSVKEIKFVSCNPQFCLYVYRLHDWRIVRI